MYPGPDHEKQQALFEELEFRRLIQRAGLPRVVEPSELAAAAAEQAPREDVITFDGYAAITDLASLKAYAAELSAAKMVAISIETSSTRLVDADLLGIALAHEPGKARYIPLGHLYMGVPKQLAIEDVVAVLRPMLTRREILKVGISLKSVVEVLLRYGVVVEGLTNDLSLSSYLLEPDDGPHDERGVGRRFLGHAPIVREELMGRGKTKRAYSDLTVEEATKLLGEAADLALRSADIAKTMLERAEVSAVSTDLEVPLIGVLARMERAGVKVDLAALQKMSGVFEVELGRLEKRCFELAGQELNLGSPKQLQKVLFEDLGLRIVKRTSTGPSTDASVLEALVDEHELPQAILDYRQLQKLKSTYADALPRMISPATGRVHTVMNQAVAATGRLSSTDPNLQNIPIRTELGRQLRTVFIAEPGRKLISVDYSQIELRLLAHFAKDALLVDAFREGDDIHRRTASMLFEVKPAEVTADQRGQAKTVNFGVLYGMGPVRLSRQLRIPRRTAQKFVDDYFERQPGVKQFKEETLERARKDGFVRTLLGRRRRADKLLSKNRVDRAEAERIAFNTPIQGSAADLIKLAMLRVHARIHDEHPDVALILQVHDELLLEAPASKAEAVAAMVKREMESVYPLEVPLIADVHWGATWDEAH